MVDAMLTRKGTQRTELAGGLLQTNKKYLLYKESNMTLVTSGYFPISCMLLIFMYVQI